MSGKFMMNGIEYLGGGGGNVDDVQVNGTTVVDSNKVAQITSYKELTRAEYDLLPDTKYSDGIMYCISDGFDNANGFPPLIYSTEEREVGVWIDGKPLHEKTITFVSYEAGYVDVSDLHIDKMVSSGGFVTQTNGNHVNIPYGVHSSDFALAYYNSSNGRLYCSYGGSFNVCDWYVTMRYTKTTDTAGSGRWATDGGLTKHYSTSEQIIGTWIDGKPIYEKVFALSSRLVINADSWGTTEISASGIKGIVNAICYDVNSSTNKFTAVNIYMADCTDTYVKLWNTRNNTLGFTHVKLQYTKTTD